MCLIALAWRAHPRYRLVLAANRDEFHARPTLPLAAWEDAPAIVGGRDALHGGGWLALRARRLAAVTNVRRPPEAEGRSRGELVADFVRADSEAVDALYALAHDAVDYRPFNLLVHDGETLAFATNMPHPSDAKRGFGMRALAPGVHGVSNGALDAPWSKTDRTTERLARWLESPETRGDDVPDLAPLFDALADTRVARDEDLPDTGVGLERERFLSSPFIRNPIYGTRASTVVLITEEGAEIVERRFGPDASPAGEIRMTVPFDGG